MTPVQLRTDLEEDVVVPEVAVDERPELRVAVAELLVQRLGVRHLPLEPPAEVLLTGNGLQSRVGWVAS